MSLDEAYLDVTDKLEPFGSATAIAQEIRRRVSAERKLTVSVGVGPNKLVAKIASDFRKPDGLTVVRPSEVEGFLAPLPVRTLNGIGPATERTLAAMEVTTVADLRALTLDRLLSRFGHWGRTLWEKARGIDERSIHDHSDRKSLSTERTFPTDLEELGDMDRVIDDMSRTVADGLLRRELAACTVTLKARYPDFETVTRSHSLSSPVSDAAAIAGCAHELLRKTEAARRSVRLLGVGASGLVPRRFEQPSLFDED
jgi:DNA polymerase-4